MHIKSRLRHKKFHNPSLNAFSCGMAMVVGWGENLRSLVGIWEGGRLGSSAWWFRLRKLFLRFLYLSLTGAAFDLYRQVK